jgi:transposase
MAYSMDLRQRAMDRLAAGETSYEAAAALKVAVSSVIKWAQRQRATGSAAPGQMGGHRPAKISDANRDWVLAEVERSPHVTIAVLSAGLAARGLTIHPASVARFLHREGKSFKKNRSSRRAGDAPQTGAAS